MESNKSESKTEYYGIELWLAFIRMMKDLKLAVLIQNYGGLYNNCLTKILLLQIRKNGFAGHQPINFLINTMNTE